MVEAAFVTHFPIPPIYPYLPFTPGYLIYYPSLVWTCNTQAHNILAHINTHTYSFTHTNTQATVKLLPLSHRSIYWSKQEQVGNAYKPTDSASKSLQTMWLNAGCFCVHSDIPHM